MDKELLARSIVLKLHQAGFEAYFAGGCVRDRLRGVPAKDYDIATSARPEQVQALFEKTVPVGAHFGVILVLLEGVSFEVATFRTEGGYLDGRHPTQISFSNLQEDAKRRDFTVNGLYWDVRKNKVIDYVGGVQDIQKKMIQTIGDANARFLEDHLRIMRATRFAAQLEFEIDEKTRKAMKAHAKLIKNVSSERIRDELVKTLTSKNPARGIRLMDEVGILPEILPEIETMKGVEQPQEYHPEGDVYIHTLMLLEQLSNAPIELAMGALLHDVAKPATFHRAADRIRFHGHDRIGADMSRNILKRLTFPNDQTDTICELVLEHLKFKDAFQMRVSTLKRFLTMEHFDWHLELHRIDCLASHKNLDAYHFCQKKLEELKALPPPPLKLITGADLIQLGFSPGPHFSKMLREVEDAILEGHVLTREDALAFIKKNYSGQEG